MVSGVTADHGMPQPDLYQLLGVSRGASREQIAQAWRRRARAEHPDSRPRDAAAPARFRALAEAYQVLGDPGRRAAYDRVLGHQPGPDGAAPDPAPARGTPVRPPGAGVRVTVTPAARAAEPPLWAGPVRIEGGRPGPAAGFPAADQAADEAADEAITLAVLALRYLAAGWGRPW